MIQVARIYEPAKKNGGWRVLVHRLWPRGVKKENAPRGSMDEEIAPSEALRKWFGHTPERWPEFQRRYRAELAKKKELMTELKQAEKTHGTLTLVFGAKDKERNQAIVLMNLLKNKK
jgi:uncharacterized protein YeaO (DUF488 family)